ncbi:ATP-binding protein [Deltaproteobacteria bacterium TL4]
MKPPKLELLIETLKSQDLTQVEKLKASLSETEKWTVASESFEIMKYLISSTLNPSINQAFLKISTAMESLFFHQLRTANQNLINSPTYWTQKIELLKEIPIFDDASMLDLMTIAEDVEEIDLFEKEPFLVQGEPVRGVFLLKEYAHVYVADFKDPITMRNGIFGEEACAIGVENASATVFPSADGYGYFIPRKKFVERTMKVPGIQKRIFQMVINRAKEDRLEAYKEKRHAETKQQLIQEILDNIGHACLSINEAGEIGNYSAITEHYLNAKNLMGAPFADIALRQDHEALRGYYRALSLLFGNNTFDPELILSILPSEININHRILKLKYFFVQDSSGYVMSVFIRMEDITQERQNILHEEKQNLILGKMRQDIEGFLNMLKELERCLTSVQEFSESYYNVSKQPENEAIGALMRILHGMKGLVGQYEFHEIRNTLHLLEDCVRLIAENGFGEFEGRFLELQTEFESGFQYAQSFKENLGPEIIRMLEGVTFSQQEFEELLQTLQAGELQKACSLVTQKLHVPATTIIKGWEKDIHSLAESLGKKVELKLSLQAGLTLNKSLANTLGIDLGHLYRNAIDHGIEVPKERRALGKSETGLIHVKMYSTEQHLIILIEDDGQGLNEKKILETAKNNKYLDQNLVNQYIKSGKIWKILFMPGFSTKTSITKISGRGVGMDAVQATIRKYGGEIIMKSQQGKGSVFATKLPLNA